MAVLRCRRSANVKPIWCGGSEERQDQLAGLLFRSPIEAWLVKRPAVSKSVLRVSIELAASRPATTCSQSDVAEHY